MACERFREALTNVAAGAPAPAGLEAHVTSCAACRQELATRQRALVVADEELALLLAAEPSPELAVRIRQAVDASEAGGSALREGPWLSLRYGWLWPTMAAAVTLLMALAVAIGRGRAPAPCPRAAEVTPRPQPSQTTRTSEPAVRPFEPRASAQRRATVLTPRTGGPRDGRAPEPEVLVPPGEGEALLRFAAHVQTRVVSADSLLVADVSGPLTEPKGVEIQPLVIVPLDPAEPSGTD